MQGAARLGVQKLLGHRSIQTTMQEALLASGVLGHASITMTMRYSHVADDQMVEAVKKLK